MEILHVILAMHEQIYSFTHKEMLSGVNLVPERGSAAFQVLSTQFTDTEHMVNSVLQLN